MMRGIANPILDSGVSLTSPRHHASYPVAISAMWRALLPEYEIQIQESSEVWERCMLWVRTGSDWQDHSFDDRYCQLHGTCSADSRFAWPGSKSCGGVMRASLANPNGFDMD